MQDACVADTLLCGVQAMPVTAAAAEHSSFVPAGAPQASPERPGLGAQSAHGYLPEAAPALADAPASARGSKPVAQDMAAQGAAGGVRRAMEPAAEEAAQAAGAGAGQGAVAGGLRAGEAVVPGLLAHAEAACNVVGSAGESGAHAGSPADKGAPRPEAPAHNKSWEPQAGVDVAAGGRDAKAAGGKAALRADIVAVTAAASAGAADAPAPPRQGCRSPRPGPAAAAPDEAVSAATGDHGDQAPPRTPIAALAAGLSGFFRGGRPGRPRSVSASAEVPGARPRLREDSGTGSAAPAAGGRAGAASLFVANPMFHGGSAQSSAAPSPTPSARGAAAASSADAKGSPAQQAPAAAAPAVIGEQALHEVQQGDLDAQAAGTPDPKALNPAGLRPIRTGRKLRLRRLLSTGSSAEGEPAADALPGKAAQVDMSEEASARRAAMAAVLSAPAPPRCDALALPGSPHPRLGC